MKKKQMIDEKKRAQVLRAYSVLLESMEFIEKLGGNSIPFVKEHFKKAINLLKKKHTSIEELKKFYSDSTVEIKELIKNNTPNDATE